MEYIGIGESDSNISLFSAASLDKYCDLKKMPVSSSIFEVYVDSENPHLTGWGNSSGLQYIFISNLQSILTFTHRAQLESYCYIFSFFFVWFSHYTASAHKN